MIDLALGAYESTILSLGVLATLLLVQLLIADVLGIVRGHTPGTPVAASHDDLLFRATRTVANTNESIAIFIVLVLFNILSGGDPSWTAYLAWTYVGARGLYAICYYSNLQIPRSVVFGASLIALLGLLINGFLA